MRDLCSCWDAMHNVIVLQHNKTKASFDKSLNLMSQAYKGIRYKRLIGRVSRYPLGLIVHEVERILKYVSNESLLELCIDCKLDMVHEQFKKVKRHGPLSDMTFMKNLLSDYVVVHDRSQISLTKWMTIPDIGYAIAKRYNVHLQDGYPLSMVDIISSTHCYPEARACAILTLNARLAVELSGLRLSANTVGKLKLPASSMISLPNAWASTLSVISSIAPTTERHFQRLVLLKEMQKHSLHPLEADFGCESSNLQLLGQPFFHLFFLVLAWDSRKKERLGSVDPALCFPCFNRCYSGNVTTSFSFEATCEGVRGLGVNNVMMAGEGNSDVLRGVLMTTIEGIVKLGVVLRSPCILDVLVWKFHIVGAIDG
ncbi:hypothetical protein V8G54_027159 [Vigna mungo]|uniref:Uncharacterized protein n=1 Tax=Vigna mungo TaxID=3915 RepID=A0AAQ3N1X4_VIGMU